MWVTYLKEHDGHPVGETVEIADAKKAKALIDLEYAKEGKAPEANDEPIATELKSFAKSVAMETAEEILKKLNATPARKPVLGDGGYETGTAKTLTLPATAKKWSSVKSFSGKGEESYAKAYRFGMFIAAVYGKTWARKWCANNGLPMVKFDDDMDTKDASENQNITAGFLVPEEFQGDIIDLREKYGVARKECRIVPMTSDIRRDPRRRDGVPVFFVGEAATGTKGDMQWDQVSLTAKKLMGLSKFSSELSEDAIINYGDTMADEFAYAFALKEDQCWYSGDTTSTYGGITGLGQAVLNLDATPANLVGATVGAAGTGASWGFTLAKFNAVVGSLPEYADGNAKWYTSKAFWGTEMQRLATAAGGNQVGQITGGARTKEFLGYEVVISQVFPKVPANNSLVAVFGDMRRAVSFGTRREITLAMSNAALNAFENDQTVLRATERFDIVVHDIGDTSSKAARSAQAGRVAGPIVFLYTASS